MSRVFISYRREDTKWMARALKDRLNEAYGEDSVFMDVDSIDLGHDFVDAIEEAVAKVDVVIVLIGRKWLEIKDGQGHRRIENPNDFVRIEIVAALKRDIRLIPLLERGAVMPSPDELPEDLQPLARRNALEIADTGFDQDVGRLISSLNRMWEDDQKGNSVFGDEFVQGVQAMMAAEAESTSEPSADANVSPRTPVAATTQSPVPVAKKPFPKWLIPALAVVCLLVVAGLAVVFNPLSNNLPSAADKTIQLDEGDSYTFGEDDFGFQDDDNDDELRTIRITDLRLPGGSLMLEDEAVTGDEEIAAADIAGSKLKFIPNLEADAREPAHFSFQVTDGKDYSVSTYKITFKIAATLQRRLVGHWFNKDYEASDDISLSSLRIDFQENEIHVYPWKKSEGQELPLITVGNDKDVEVQPGAIRITVKDPGRFWPLNANLRQYELHVAPQESDSLEIWLLNEAGRLGTEPKYEFEKRSTSPQLTVARMNVACREENWDHFVACFSPTAQHELAVFVLRRHLEYFRSFAGDDHITTFHEKYGIALEHFDLPPETAVPHSDSKEDAFMYSLNLSQRKSFLADALTIWCDRHGAKTKQIAAYLAVPRAVLSSKLNTPQRTFWVEAQLDRIELRAREETVLKEVNGKKVPVTVTQTDEVFISMPGHFVFVWDGSDWLLDEGPSPLPSSEAPPAPDVAPAPEAPPAQEVRPAPAA